VTHESRRDPKPAAALTESYTRLLSEIQALIKEKERNERRWSKVSSATIVLLLIVLTAATIITSLVVDLRAIPAILAALTGAVSTVSAILPYEKKRLGNKVLIAKANDIRERAEDLRDGIGLSAATEDELYGRLAQLRYEKNVLCATSSTQAALRPFREVLE